MDKISAEFASALIKATSNIEGAVKDSVNPHFRSKYADLASVIQAVKKPLIDQGITFIQPTLDKEIVSVETLLVYKTGEILSLGTVSIKPEKAGPQGYMAALTYARRAGLNSLGIPAFDDDGNEASGIKTHEPKGAQSVGVQQSLPVPAAIGSLSLYSPVIYYRPDLNASQEKFFKDNGAVPLNYGYWQSPKDLGPKLKKDIVSKDEYDKRAARLKESETQLQGSVDAGVEAWIQEKI